MNEKEKLIQELLQKIELLSQRQRAFQQEIFELQSAVKQLSVDTPIEQSFLQKDLPQVPAKKQEDKVSSLPPIAKEVAPILDKIKAKATKIDKSPLEEFIGTNLLNKIGIAILIIGVGIGAKYSIDHQLISPLTRIILGYLTGGILIGIAIRLKKKYLNLSAVLLSGGMAVLYFITYVAYDFYDLIPQTMAFVLMVGFTGFTVFAAIQYNQQVIAIIGLVGAYAVPVLLSDGSGRVVILFSYMTIINTGILVLAFRKAWKILYYIAFALSWIIFSAWNIDRYNVDDHLWISLGFSTLFFVTFYVTLLSYKLTQGENLKRWDIVILLTNSFIYYALGYFSVDAHQQGEIFLGLFTLFNAILHFVACFVIYKKQNATRDTFYFVAGMVLIFLTLAVPVQLEGNWVTIVWAAESTLLFWIGRTKDYVVYERLSYILIALTFFSFLQDIDEFYFTVYNPDTDKDSFRFLLNVQFLSSLMVAAALGWIVKLSRWPKEKPNDQTIWFKLDRVVSYVIPALFGITLYLSFYKEIEGFWQQRYFHSQIYDQQNGYNIYDYDLLKFQQLWLLNYTAVFTMVLGILNFRLFKNKIVAFVTTGLSALVLLNLIVSGLPLLRELRTSFMEQTDAQFYFRDYAHIIIRYVTLLFMLPLLWLNYQSVKKDYFTEGFKKAERISFHLVILSLLSSELVGTLDLAGIDDSDKLALTILWGVYGLSLIVYGLRKNLKYIRITAIVLFGITLIKLFLWDLASLPTIGKTIVLVVLGALLLVASFLYNKFKTKSDETV